MATQTLLGGGGCGCGKVLGGGGGGCGCGKVLGGGGGGCGSC